MRINKKNKNDERRILIAMIVDKMVLSRIAVRWDKPGLFKTKYANIIGGWCIRYYRKYEKPPMKHIENLYENWAAKSADDNSVKLVEKFLSNLNKEYKELKHESNSQYVIDLAEKYFNNIQLK